MSLVNKTLYPEIQKSTASLDEMEDWFQKRGVKFDGKKSADRVFDFRASDKTVDRHGDIIDPAGWILDNFKKNPVVLWQHSQQLGPIGKSLTEGVSDGALDMKLYIHDLTDESKKAFALLESGMIKATSVGFRPREIRQLSDEERSELKLGRFGQYFQKQELLEISIVTVPSNPNALSKGEDGDNYINNKVIDAIVEKLIERSGDFKLFNDLADKITAVEGRIDEVVKLIEAKEALKEIPVEDYSDLMAAIKGENP